MMRRLHDTALVGTGRQGAPRIHVDPETETLLAALPEDNPERKLLLMAGLLAVYGEAGYAPGTAEAPQKAPPETLEACSKEVGDVLSAMVTKPQQRVELNAVLNLGGPMSISGVSGAHADLLPETLTLLRQRGLRLRHVLLPHMLAAQTESVRQLLLPVLGERGRWLARFNKAWSWALLPSKSDAASLQLPPDAGRIWEEGTAEQRLDVLRRQRRIDPAQARDRLAAIIAGERPEYRTKLLDALEIDLSLDDEPFLERMLDDRAAPLVRRRAAGLLALLPDSACAARLLQRADSMLTIHLDGSLTVSVPATLDPSWQREGLLPSSRIPGTDVQGAWLLETVGLVPVRHWVARFRAPLEKLIDSLQGERALEVLEAWTVAATRHGETDLLPALWDGWWARRHTPLRAMFLLATMLSQLAQSMNPTDLEGRLCDLLADPPPAVETTCGRVLQQVPWPWPDRLGDVYVGVLRQVLMHLEATQEPRKSWLYALVPGARGIPAQHISPALAALDVLPHLEPAEKTLEVWPKILELVAEKLRLRQRLIEELAI